MDTYIWGGQPGGGQVQDGSPGGACFAQGTYILTRTGDVRIENLRVGGTVATLTGSFAPIKWIGRRKIDFHSMSEPDASANRPVFITKSSLADQIPHTDLILSRYHAVLCRGLGTADSLANGKDVYIMRDMDEVTYYHLELDTFEFIIANGLAAESYRDVGNRTWFDNYAEWQRESLKSKADAQPGNVDLRLRAAVVIDELRAKT